MQNLFQKSLCASACVLLLLTSCMSSQKEEELKNSINSIALQVAELKADLAKKDQSLSQVTSTVTTVSKSVADTTGLINELQEQLRLARGNVDEMSFKIERLEKVQSTSTKEDSSIILNDLKREVRFQNMKILRLEWLNEGGFKSTRKLPKVEASYEVGLVKMEELNKNKKYEELADYATVYLMDLAITPQIYAECLRLRGEALFRLKEYRLAGIDFIDYYTRFNTIGRIDRVGLFLGDSFVFLNRKDLAKISYEWSVKSGNTEESNASKDRLTRMSGI